MRSTLCEPVLSIIDYRTRVSPWLVSHDIHPHPLPLLLKLVDGRRAEGIRRRQENALALLL